MSKEEMVTFNVYDQTLVSATTPAGLIFRGQRLWNHVTGAWVVAATTIVGASHEVAGTTFPSTNNLGINFDFRGLNNPPPIGEYDFVYTDAGNTYIGGVKIRVTEDDIFVVPE